jgi:hypothetical protein
MANLSINQVDEVLFSFSYAQAQQASRCNEKLSLLMRQSIISEIEAGFDQFNYSGLQLELDSLEVNLGRLSEDDISYRLGEKIKLALIEALKQKLSERMGVNPFIQNELSARTGDFALIALKSFFLKGYFPSWVDSAWDLFSILEELLAARSSSLGQMIREISRYSEAARKRIAFLDTKYFDRIILVLVPNDANWILGYRESYGEIHESEGKLSGSSEDLKRALNLFILNFITQDAGPKFNRLSFMNRFLGALAAHYNLDFKLFLKEIIRLVIEIPSSNPLQQDFKEAITWVGEKNLVTDLLKSDIYEPNQADLLTWLNQGIENIQVEKWVNELGLEGVLFHELARRFPSFWKNLNPTGLDNLVVLLSKKDAPVWKQITEGFIGLTAKQTAASPVQKSEYLIGLFDYTQEWFNPLNLNLFDKSDWYFVQLLFFFEKPVQGTISSQELIEIGLTNGVSNAPIIWSRAKKRINATGIVFQITDDLIFRSGSSIRKEEEITRLILNKSVPDQETMIFDYLKSGLTGGISEKWGKNNLAEILSNLLWDQNPIVLDWIKKYGTSKNSGFKTRLRRLLIEVEKKQLVDYGYALEGSGFLTLLLPILDYSKPDVEVRKKQSSDLSDQEKARLIFDYLQKKSLPTLNEKFVKADVLSFLSALIEKRDPILLMWISKARQGSNSNFRLRLKELISLLNRGEIMAYVSELNGKNSLREFLNSDNLDGDTRADSYFKKPTESMQSSNAVDLVETFDIESKESIQFESRTFQELALLGYLNSGSLSVAFQNLAKADLVELLSGFMKDQNPVLMDWIQKGRFLSNSSAGQRLWGLASSLDRKELIAFVAKSATYRAYRLIELDQLISEQLDFPTSKLVLSDRILWFTFLGALSSNKSEENSLVSIAQTLKSASNFLTSLRKQIPSNLENSQKFSALFKELNFLKSLLIGYSLNPEKIKFYETLPFLFSAKGSFLSAVQPKSIRLASNPTGLGIAWTSLRLNVENRSEKKFFKSLLTDIYQLSAEAKEKSESENRKKAALVLLKSDLAKVKRVALYFGDQAYQKSEVKQAIKRIFKALETDPSIAVPLLLKEKEYLFFMLPVFKNNLDAKGWIVFKRWMDRHFGMEFRKSLNFWESTNDSTLVQLLRLGNLFKSTMNLNSTKTSDINHKLATVDSFISFRAELNILFGNSPDTVTNLLSLFNLPDSVFKRRQSGVLWRKLLLQSLIRFKKDSVDQSEVSVKVFWEIFSDTITSFSSYLEVDSMNWEESLRNSKLTSVAQTILSQFLHQNYTREQYELNNTSSEERLLEAIFFLKAEGFLPWWSPFRTKTELIKEVLRRIEISKSEETSALISALVTGDVSKMILGIHQDELYKLREILLDSKYSKHFQDLNELIDSRISKLYSRIQEVDEVKLKKGRTNWIEVKNFKNLASVHQERETKKWLNAGKESVLIRKWFGNDPRILKQMNELIRWSPLIYFGSLNPSKWKMWLLLFGFDFYVNRGQSYSRGFLSQFLSYLMKRQAAINWKGVVHRLVRNKDFLTDQNKFYRAELLNIFPIEEKIAPVESKTGDQVRVKNAGLVLCWPFLSVLFSRLKLSVGNKIPEENLSKAVYLLQHLVFGHSDFPEYELVLNKLMVGMKSGQHLEKVALSQEEKDMTESLLSGMKSNWEKMKNASVQAIRETFLQREGLLEFGDESFILRVPKTGVDILLDSVSWNIAVIRLPWMEKPIEVKWR